MEKYTNLNLNYINGEWKDGSGDKKIIDNNPYSGEEIAAFKVATLEDIDEAYKGAEEKQKSWGNTNAYKRNEIINKAVQIMKERYDEIIDIIVRETGSTVIKAHVELDSCIGVTARAAGYPFHMETNISPSIIPGKKNYIVKKPAGVIGVISPFNFPMFLAMRTVAPALAAGNGVVLKPSSSTPIAGGTLIAKIFEEAGIPKGVLSVVTPKSSEIGDGFYEHPVPSVISFTGSTAVGQRIGEVAGREVKKTMLELGGNNALVVLDDADVDYAVKSAVFGRYFHSGQICMSTNRIIVDQSIFDEFAEKFVELTKNLKVGDPSKDDTLVGPVIDEKEANRILEWVEKAKKEGAEVLLEGKKERTLVYPYVIKATNETWTAKKEMFGPVANLIVAKDEEDALKIANDTEAGLSGAVHTKDKERGFKFAKGWKTGMVHINDQSVNDEPGIAFGGEKKSGIGRFGREITLDEVTTYMWISDQEEPREYPL
jgi:aldehyde dehydrogenase (NAD+)